MAQCSISNGFAVLLLYIAAFLGLFVIIQGVDQ